MERIREVIVVEGRYDKNALKQTVDATVVETGGFGVFNDRERLALLRRLAAQRGLILLTDSDGAGFVIRNFLKGAIPKSQQGAAQSSSGPGGQAGGGGHAAPGAAPGPGAGGGHL